MSRAALEPGLRQGLDDLGLILTQTQITQLLDYLDLLAKWNRVYNLTAVREPRDMLGHHLFDSLAVIVPLRRELVNRAGDAARLLDVGSGAGLPGVVIAICCPDIVVTCVDAVAKKTAFIRQVSAALGLSNLQARHARVESLVETYDLVCSRAFASLLDFVTWTSHVLAPNGCWLAMKGQPPMAEIAALPSGIEVFHVEQLTVPSLGAQRCIVWMAMTRPG